jgi:tetratricopeptide (TPR) repeat protein
MLKYENFIRNNPEKAHGYYCVGKLCFKLGQYKAAESYFKKALFISNSHTAAKIWLITCYIYRRKLLKALNYYENIEKDVNSKKVYKMRLASLLSSLYRDNVINSMSHGFISQLHLKYAAQAVEKTLRKDTGSIFANLLISMYFLSKRDISRKALLIHSKTVEIDGINDDFRWALVRILFKDDPSVYRNKNIADKFSDIPSSDCPSLFVNTVFEASLNQNIKQKIQRMAVSIDSNSKTLTHFNLWKYITWCRDNEIYDTTVFSCCKKLLRTGWIDKTLFETFLKLKKLGIAKDTEKEDRLFTLYGYQ